MPQQIVPESSAPSGGEGGKRRIGVMGGTFDPIHHGHLVAASEVAALFHLDEVVFVPTGSKLLRKRPTTVAELLATAKNYTNANDAKKLIREDIRGAE